MTLGLSMDALHVAWPGLVREEQDDGACSLYNPGHGTSIDVTPESRELVERVLAAFAEPSSPRAFCAAEPDVPVDLLVLLARSGMLVVCDELAFLEHGFLRPAAAPIGPSWTWSDVPEYALEDAWVVLGVPSDMAALGSAGARHGPSEVRKVMNGALVSGQGDVVDHEFSRLYRGFSPKVADLGDVEPDGGRLDHVGARLAKAVRDVLTFGMRPLVLGGDHALTHFVLGALIARGEPFGIVHFDAHADLGPSRTLSHANVFGEALASEHVRSFTQIGLRGIERVSPFARRVPCAKRRVISAAEARRGRALAALEALPRDIPYYLTFDIDCVDAASAPETGTPLFAGMSVELVTELVDHVARELTLIGADFVEVSAARSGPNAAALIAASLVQRVLLGEAEFEPLSTDVYVL